jgi:signal peptidase I
MQADQSENENESDEYEQKRKEQLKQATVSYFTKVIVIVLGLWIVFHFVFGLYRMNGECMYPRIRDGDLILYYRMENTYAIGDVVTYKIDEHRKTARIVAMGGDVVSLNEDGQLLVNGNVQEEEIFYPTEKIIGGVSYPYTVPEDSYFVLCDFRTSSYDSRDYGAVSQADINGKVITILRRRGI